MAHVIERLVICSPLMPLLQQVSLHRMSPNSGLPLPPCLQRVLLGPDCRVTHRSRPIALLTETPAFPAPPFHFSECYLDLTAEAQRRLAACGGEPPLPINPGAYLQGFVLQ